MGHYAVAWLEDEDRSGAETGIAAVADAAMIETSGDTLKLRAGRNRIALMYGWTEFTAYPIDQLRLNAPSYPLKNIRMSRGVALNFDSANLVYDYRDNPITMVPGEAITSYGFEDDEGGVAHYLGVVAIVTDRPIPKGPAPEYDTVVQGTATSATAAVWQALTITLRDTLPAGYYDFYGADVVGATVVAARFIIPGLNDRPAVIPRCREQDALHPFSQYWGAPVRFAYPGNLPVLNIIETSGAGTVKVEMYLKKVKSGLP